VVTLALSSCSLPGPYQTYSPGTPAAPSPPANALVVYGVNTTTPENEMDTVDAAPNPTTASNSTTPAPEPAAPATTTAAGSQRVAICYSRLWSSADAVHTSAVQACGGKAARIVGQDTDLDACPALAPTHAIFACGQ
jgi:hypothetical protein